MNNQPGSDVTWNKTFVITKKTKIWIWSEASTYISSMSIYNFYVYPPLMVTKKQAVCKWWTGSGGRKVSTQFYHCGICTKLLLMLCITLPTILAEWIYLYNILNVLYHCIVCPDFGSRDAAGVASVRSLYKLLPVEPMLAGSKEDPLLDKAEPTSNSGRASERT